MADEGLCLRVDQPYAGLLVCGIKKHEGFNELFTHRGRLWISSSEKIPTIEEVREVEAFYIRTRGTILFPSGYPPDYLIGCVDVVNCLTHDDYVQKHPEHPETDSDYVLVCQNPRCLPRLQFHVPGAERVCESRNYCPKLHNGIIKDFCLCYITSDYKLDPLMHAEAVKVLNKQKPNPLLGEEYFVDGKK